MPKAAIRNLAIPANIAPAVQESRWSYRVSNVAGQNPAIHLRGVIGLSSAYNEYGGDYAGTFRELAEEIEALGNVAEIDLFIFSPGGYIWPAMALHDLIVRHPARFNGIVDGLAASSATIVLMACDVVKVPRNAQIMIHNAVSWADGDYRAMEQTAKLLRRETRNIADLYAQRITATTGRDDHGVILEEMVTMMADETYLTGSECLALGLADEVGDEIDLPGAMNRNRRELGSLNLANLRPEVRALFDRPANPNPTNAMSDPVTPPVTPSVTPPVTTTPANVTPAVTPPVEVTPPVTAPVNVTPPIVSEAPIAPDMPTMLANAVATALKPVTDQVTALATEVTALKNLQATGAPANTFGNQSPVPAPAGGGGEAPVDFAKLTPGQKISLGRKNLLDQKKA